MNLELCTDCVEGAKIADKYGFKRIELCSALSEGGLTPSIGLIKACAEAAGRVEVHAMIRTRGGSFSCSDEELKVMMEDIRQAARAGAKGVVFGILDAHGRISQKNLELVEIAKSSGLQATFHRAFDGVENPMGALQVIVDMGFNRLLSSGLQEKAIEGILMIQAMQERFGNKVEIMAGSGVNSDNAARLAQTGIDNLHFTARKKESEDFVEGMGIKMSTDEQKIRDVLKVLAMT